MMVEIERKNKFLYEAFTTAAKNLTRLEKLHRETSLAVFDAREEFNKALACVEKIPQQDEPLPAASAIRKMENGR